MRARLAFTALLAAHLLSPSGSSAVVPQRVEGLLREATVRVGSGCSGVLVDGPDLVLTAAHCIRDRASVELGFAGGSVRTGWVAAVDSGADQALLLLEEPVASEPMQLARRTPITGTVLFFGGNPAQPHFQEARLDRLGRCPSLPRLGNALFTTIHGRPGDSGAPLVDGAGRVVGIVHGGAQCEIATPASTALRLVERLFADDQAGHAERAQPSGAGGTLKR